MTHHESAVDAFIGAVALVLADTALFPPSGTLVERLGEIGAIFAAAWAMLQWFMKQLEKKDAMMHQINETAAAAQRTATDQMLKLSHDSNDAHLKVSAALAELTNAIRVLKR